MGLFMMEWLALGVVFPSLEYILSDVVDVLDIGRAILIFVAIFRFYWQLADLNYVLHKGENKSYYLLFLNASWIYYKYTNQKKSSGLKMKAVCSYVLRTESEVHSHCYYLISFYVVLKTETDQYLIILLKSAEI
jgi:hypothetical protein